MAERFPFNFNKIENASQFAEWFFFLLGATFCIISIIGNAYVSYRLVNIIRASKAIQTPIYLSLTLCGLITGVLCMPYMLYAFYTHRLDNSKLGALLSNSASNPTSVAMTTTTPSTLNISSPSYYTTSTRQYSCSDETFGMSLWERVLCNIAGAVFNITSRLLVWIMLLLSLDRYIFICKPYRIHMVKKQHYVLWIVFFALIVIILSAAPFVFYHRDVIEPDRPPHCPVLVYQPYRFIYSTSYVCGYDTFVLLNEPVRESGSPGPLVFYIFAIVIFLLLPIISNIVLSFKVLFEVLRMRNTIQESTRYRKTGQGSHKYTQINGLTEHIELDEICGPVSCPGSVLSTFKFEENREEEENKGASQTLLLCSRFYSKLGDMLKWIRRGTVIENKASFTMVVLSLFHIVTYFAWVMVWLATIRRFLNLDKDLKEPPTWIFLYHSRSKFAYNIMNHYPQATFANAAFVPCLLGYSLHRGKH